jgi:NADH-quinone oxidoreductase subunit E
VSDNKTLETGSPVGTAPSVETQQLTSLQEKYSKEIEQILAKYPPEQKRSAVMPLLYLAQREKMYVTKTAMAEIAEILDLSTTEVASIIGFYTLYYDEQAGKYHVQVCTDLPCAMRGAEEFLEKLCENLGIRVGETTPDGMVTVEHVMCLAGCDRAPLFQVQSGDGLEYYENQTVESALEVIKNLVEGAPAHHETPPPSLVETQHAATPSTPETPSPPKDTQ